MQANKPDVLGGVQCDIVEDLVTGNSSGIPSAPAMPVPTELYMNYIQGKTIPSNISADSNCTMLPDVVTPTERTCPLCSTSPSLHTVCLSRAARIYDLDHVKEGRLTNTMKQ